MDKIISLDFDDCMYDLMELNINYVEYAHGLPNIDSQIESYYWLYQNFPDIGNVLWNNVDHYTQGKLVPGAKEFYDKLVSLVGEDKIQIVTSSMPDVIEEKNQMIKSFGFNCDVVHSIFNVYPKYHFTKNTILIEDHMGNVRDHILYNQCYGIVFNHRKLNYIRTQAIDEFTYYAETFDELFKIIERRLMDYEKM